MPCLITYQKYTFWNHKIALHTRNSLLFTVIMAFSLVFLCNHSTLFHQNHFTITVYCTLETLNLVWRYLLDCYNLERSIATLEVQTVVPATQLRVCYHSLPSPLSISPLIKFEGFLLEANYTRYKVIIEVESFFFFFKNPFKIQHFYLF